MRSAFGAVLAAAAAVGPAAAADLPAVPYGAVYFRKSNPPPEDWERDYKQAAADGMNTFRHWVLWGAVEVEPGRYDWADYDRQLDLAAKVGIRTILAEVTHSAPEWAFRKYAHARYETAQGVPQKSLMRDSSATGGFPGLDLNDDEARAAAGRFLTALAARYRGHPAMAGYDVWNECNTGSSGLPYNFGPATKSKFRLWLKAKYGTPAALGKAWRRYSYAAWDDVEPPRDRGPYPDSLDWAEFRVENAYELMKWRVDTVKAADPKGLITAHGVDTKPLEFHAEAAHDAWRAAALVDVYGYTGGSAHDDRLGTNWKRWCAADLTRAAGKPFWAAEMSAGPGGQFRGTRPARVATGRDVRLANLIGLAGGATGVFSSRWRGLLDGPLVGSYAYYELDGSPTDRSAMGGRVARWANDPARAALWQSRPVRGDVGIVVANESQVFCDLLFGSAEPYARSAEGAYRAFLDANVQADWVQLPDIDRYTLLYLPLPLMLKAETAKALAGWVGRGGRLVSDGCPGYFGDGGRAGTVQPGLGLDAVFGARQQAVEFNPDPAKGGPLQLAGGQVAVGVCRQAYTLAGGTAVARYPDGGVAAVEHQFGKGKTLLVGTAAARGYDPGGKGPTGFFAGLPKWAGVEPRVRRTGPAVARLHDGPGGEYLWLLNHTDKPAATTVTLAGGPPLAGCELVWGEGDPRAAGREVRATVPPVDGLVLKLTRADR